MVTAIVLAAGLSRRMGSPKMVLPWGNTTVLGKVLRTLKSSGLEDIEVVTGASSQSVERICQDEVVRIVRNPDFEAGEMLSSLQAGLQAASDATDAALIVLGDQPALQKHVVEAVLDAHAGAGSSLVIPSYRRRRGHPWLVGREWWPELIALRPPDTARDFLHRHPDRILYVELDAPSIISDLDTPEEYLKSRP